MVGAELEFIDITRRYAQLVVATFPGLWQLVHTSPSGNSRVYRRTDIRNHLPDHAAATGALTQRE